jgi:protein gp37
VSKDTKIPWCDSTANPVVGCDGCELHGTSVERDSCYAAALVGRYAGLPGWPESFDKPERFGGRIEEACLWPDLTGRDRPAKPWLNGFPRTIFLGDLADVFTESIPLDWLGLYLTEMGNSPHIWILCTKRPWRARQFFEQWGGCPPNFWILTTVTSVTTLHRITELQRIPGATVRGVSLEPLLGPVGLSKWLTCNRLGCAGKGSDHVGLDWVIVGGESGPRARPMLSSWAFDLLDQCTTAGVPFFFKQWSEWIDCGCAAFGRKYYGLPRHVRSDGTFWPDGAVPTDENADVTTIVRAGVKEAGTELAGREWYQMPEVRR